MKIMISELNFGQRISKMVEHCHLHSMLFQVQSRSSMVFVICIDVFLVVQKHTWEIDGKVLRWIYLNEIFEEILDWNWKILESSFKNQWTWNQISNGDTRISETIYYETSAKRSDRRGDRGWSERDKTRCFSISVRLNFTTKRTVWFDLIFFLDSNC